MESFYIFNRPTPKKIKEIFLWAKDRAIHIDVDMLDGKQSIRRIPANKTFQEVLDLLTPTANGFFRMVHHNPWRGWGVISDYEKYNEIVSLFVRGIEEEVLGPEYFIFLYLPVDNLSYLLEKYSFKKL